MEHLRLSLKASEYCQARLPGREVWPHVMRFRTIMNGHIDNLVAEQWRQGLRVGHDVTGIRDVGPLVNSSRPVAMSIDRCWNEPIEDHFWQSERRAECDQH